MTTKLQNKLIDLMQAFLDESGEDRSTWVHDGLAEQMALAAIQVYKATEDVQQTIAENT